jgi:hypothetical protein
VKDAAATTAFAGFAGRVTFVTLGFGGLAFLLIVFCSPKTAAPARFVSAGAVDGAGATAPAALATT